MLILGIETSCDETAAAVVEGGRVVRSSVVWSQHELHAEYAGVVPELASRAHVERVLPTVRRAMDEAGVTLGELDAVAVGHRPGLIGSLLVGVAAAKALAWSLDLPLVGVDHVHAHLYAGVLGLDEPDGTLFPALGLVVSGGHTATYLLRSWTQLERLGSTIDDALGEAFDKAATILGLPHPGGPNLDRLASTPGADDRAHDFPISRLGRDSLDFSFSGLKTAVLYATRGVPGPGGVHGRDAASLSHESRAGLAASFQRVAVETVVLKLARARSEAERRAGGRVATLLAGGGVTANSRLRPALLGLPGFDRVLLPPMRFCVDNAAMIAGLARHLPHDASAGRLALRPVPTSAC